MYNTVLKSCKNLGTYADIYFVHQVDEGNEDVTFGRYGAVDALNELKAEGKIKFTGVASHYCQRLKRVLYLLNATDVRGADVYTVPKYIYFSGSTIIFFWARTTGRSENLILV